MERELGACEGCGSMIDVDKYGRCGYCEAKHYWPVWYRRVMMPKDPQTAEYLKITMKPDEVNYVI